MTTEIDNTIIIEPAPDLGPGKCRAWCPACTRTFPINSGRKLVICPTCGNKRNPDWDDNKTNEEQQ